MTEENRDLYTITKEVLKKRFNLTEEDADKETTKIFCKIIKEIVEEDLK